MVPGIGVYFNEGVFREGEILSGKASHDLLVNG